MATAAERFAAKVDQAGPFTLVRGVTGRCHIWRPKPSEKGYGRFWLGKTVRAHRFAYEQAVGPIPDGYDIDHRCRNRRCVRPSHLEAVTHRVNVLRSTNHVALRAAQTHCHAGHAFDKTNTYVAPNGTRKCRACAARRSRATTTERQTA